MGRHALAGMVFVKALRRGGAGRSEDQENEKYKPPKTEMKVEFSTLPEIKGKQNLAFNKESSF